jgi:two-component system CheB/CheR fusion protein
MLGYVKILRDLTERKNAEDSIKNHVQELEELNTHRRMSSQFLMICGPLSSIIATTKYLKDNFERMKPETVKEMLELVYDSSIAELNMLDSLVDWARIKYASEIFSPTKVKLSKYVDQTLI